MLLLQLIVAELKEILIFIRVQKGMEIKLRRWNKEYLVVDRMRSIVVVEEEEEEGGGGDRPDDPSSSELNTNPFY